MKYFVFYGLPVAAFLLVLYFLPLQVKVKGKKEQENISLEIEINIFFVNIIKFALNLLNESRNMTFKVLGINLKGGKGQKSLLGKKTDEFNIDIRRINILDIFQLLKDILKRTTVDKFYIALRIGMEDAACTAISTGSLWGIVYTSLMPLYNNARFLYPPEVHIMPLYGERTFEGNLICIFKSRCGN
ncbi:MAG: DUF2953 domain-containing protein, partial [Caldanaerobacter sp.]